MSLTKHGVAAHRRCIRRLALAQGVLFALALVLAPMHRATVVHGHCSDHGQTIHLVPSAARAPADHSRMVWTVPAYVAGSHGCPFLAFLTHAKMVRSSSRVLSVETGTPGALAAVTPRWCPGIPLLLQAPKHSPPRG